MVALSVPDQPCHVRSRARLATLRHHTAAIAALRMTTAMAFSASQDCTVCQWAVKDFVLVREFLGHGQASTPAVHPSSPFHPCFLSYRS